MGEFIPWVEMWLCCLRAHTQSGSLTGQKAMEFQTTQLLIWRRTRTQLRRCRACNTLALISGPRVVFSRPVLAAETDAGDGVRHSGRGHSLNVLYPIPFRLRLRLVCLEPGVGGDKEVCEGGGHGGFVARRFVLVHILGHERRQAVEPCLLRGDVPPAAAVVDWESGGWESSIIALATLDDADVAA